MIFRSRNSGWCWKLFRAKFQHRTSVFKCKLQILFDSSQATAAAELMMKRKTFWILVEIVSRIFHKQNSINAFWVLLFCGFCGSKKRAALSFRISFGRQKVHTENALSSIFYLQMRRCSYVSALMLWILSVQFRLVWESKEKTMDVKGDNVILSICLEKSQKYYVTVLRILSGTRNSLAFTLDGALTCWVIVPTQL